jgi:hypothetical protein
MVTKLCSDAELRGISFLRITQTSIFLAQGKKVTFPAPSPDTGGFPGHYMMTPQQTNKNKLRDFSP